MKAILEAVVGALFAALRPRAILFAENLVLLLFTRAVVKHPAGCAARLALLAAGSAVAFRLVKALGTRFRYHFVATYRRPTRSRAYASTDSLPRPLQGSQPTRPGSALVGRDSHPQDDASEFRGLIAHSFLTSRAWSQLTIGIRGPRDRVA